MTEEMQNVLEREMQDALALEDPERRHDACFTVLIHQNSALIDCQRKTSDRVKVLTGERDGARYGEAIDPISKHRVYVETDEPIVKDEPRIDGEDLNLQIEP